MTESLLRFPLLTGKGVVLATLLFLLPAHSFAANPCADGGSPVPVAVQQGPGDEGGVGGTGAKPETKAGKEDKKGGIGGTGIAKHDTEGGIGGTGIEAETAIIGTVTGFASICVGGTEIHYDRDTPVRFDGVEAAAIDLAVGQVVQVVAADGGDRFTALSIDVDHVLAGPVTGVDVDNERVEVMGQSVLLSEAIVDAAPSELTGQWVQVSGLRRADEVVVASRIDLVDEQQARAVGVFQVTEPGRGRIGAVPVRINDGAVVEVGTAAVATGRWANGELVVERIEADRSVALRHLVRSVQVEGYIESGPAREIEVGGWTVEVPDDDRAAWMSLPPEKRVRIKAQVNRDGCLVPDAFTFTEPRRPPDRPPPNSSTGHGPDAGMDGPPQGGSEFSHKGPSGPPRPGTQGGPQGPPGGRPPRWSRPPRPERPQRPDLPRAQRPPPPPQGPRPPRPPRPPR